MINNGTLAATLARNLTSTTGKRFTAAPHASRAGRTRSVAWLAPHGTTEDDIAGNVALALGGDFPAKSYGVAAAGDGFSGNIIITTLG